MSTYREYPITTKLIEIMYNELIDLYEQNGPGKDKADLSDALKSAVNCALRYFHEITRSGGHAPELINYHISVLEHINSSLRINQAFAFIPIEFPKEHPLPENCKPTIARRGGIVKSVWKKYKLPIDYWYDRIQREREEEQIRRRERIRRQLVSVAELKAPPSSSSSSSYSYHPQPRVPTNRPILVLEEEMKAADDGEVFFAEVLRDDPSLYAQPPPPPPPEDVDHFFSDDPSAFAPEQR